MKPSQLISRAEIDGAYDKLSQQLEATTLMFEYEQRANKPLRDKVEELAAELAHNSVDFERELEAWKRGSEAQANEIERLKNALRKIWKQVLEPAPDACRREGERMKGNVKLQEIIMRCEICKGTDSPIQIYGGIEI